MSTPSPASPAGSVAMGITDLAYGVPALQREGGSHYRMADKTGSILRAAMRLRVLAPGGRPGEFSAGAQVEVFASTPRGSRRPDLLRPGPQDPHSLVVDEDVGHDTVMGEPSAYSVGGATISAGPVTAQMGRARLYTKSGGSACLADALPTLKVVNGAPGAAPQGGSEDPAPLSGGEQ